MAVNVLKHPRKKGQARNAVPELFYMQMLSWWHQGTRKGRGELTEKVLRENW